MEIVEGGFYKSHTIVAEIISIDGDEVLHRNYDLKGKPLGRIDTCPLGVMKRWARERVRPKWER